MNRAQKRLAASISSKQPAMRFKPKITRPNLAEIQGLFGHIDLMFNQLRSGYIDAANGRPIMHDGQGGWHEIAPALLGWVDLWDRIANKYKLVIDTQSLTQIANRLQYDSPLTLDLTNKGQAAIDHCRAIYSRLDVFEVRAMVNEQCRTIEIQELMKEKVAA